MRSGVDGYIDSYTLFADLHSRCAVTLVAAVGSMCLAKILPLSARRSFDTAGVAVTVL